MKKIPDILPDPDIGFNGLYVCRGDHLPPNQYKLSELAKYLQENNKKFSDLTEEEKAMFLL